MATTYVYICQMILDGSRVFNIPWIQITTGAPFPWTALKTVSGTITSKNKQSSVWLPVDAPTGGGGGGPEDAFGLNVPPAIVAFGPAMMDPINAPACACHPAVPLTKLVVEKTNEGISYLADTLYLEARSEQFYLQCLQQLEGGTEGFQLVVLHT
jgi:hypothetical protein